MADDEAWHSRLVESAQEAFAGEDEPPVSAVAIDDETKERTEGPLRACCRGINDGAITQAEMLASIAAAEFSEWNDLFLYAVRTSQAGSRKSQQLASVVEQHKRRVEAFISHLPGGQRPALAVRELPTVWERRYLVADEAEPLVDLYVAVLRDEAEVHAALNGPEALDVECHDVVTTQAEEVDDGHAVETTAPRVPAVCVPRLLCGVRSTTACRTFAGARGEDNVMTHHI